MFTKIERLISLRNLRPKKKEGFLKVISIFSFLGIMLGVAILIIVMSVMNGFKTDLTKKILGLNPHIVIQPNGFKIEEDFLKKIRQINSNFKISKTYSGEGIILNNQNAKGIIIKGIDNENKESLNFLKNISQEDFTEITSGDAFIGVELAYDLDLKIGDIRIKEGGGHGGHNGLRDILSKTGKNNYMRVRIGIGHPGLKENVTNWVLTKFSPNEKKSLAQAYEKFSDVFDMICNNQIDQAQKILHTK